MKNTIEYLNEAKKALEIESDNAMANYLGVSRSALSNYRHGTKIMDDYAAAKIAGALGIEAMFVIAAANAEREKTEERKGYWRNFYERLGGVAASLFVAVSFGVCHFESDADTLSSAGNTEYPCSQCVYYVKYKKR